MRSNLFIRYMNAIESTDLYNILHLNGDLVPFTSELVRRHKGGWRIPDSVYRDYKEVLYYKDSLERTSPYYVDLLRISDPAILSDVLYAIYQKIRLTPIAIKDNK